MKTFKVAAHLVPQLFDECSACGADLVIVARVVGSSVEFAVPEQVDPVSATVEATPPDADPLLPSDPQAPIPDDQAHSTRPNELPDESGGEHPPLQIGLPLHPDLPHPPHAGGTPIQPTSIKIERRPIQIRLLHVDERRGQGYVLVGRAVRRVAIDGTIAELRELREIISANNPQLTTDGTFDVSGCVSLPNITFNANELLRQFAAVDQAAVAREHEVN